MMSMNRSILIPLFTAYICIASKCCTIEKLASTYSGLLVSNFEDFAVLDGTVLDIFNPKMYNEKYESEALANNIAASLVKFLSPYNDKLQNTRCVLPKKDLRRILAKYPDSFVSLRQIDPTLFEGDNLVIDRLLCLIEFRQMSDCSPSKMYKLFLSDRDVFKVVMQGKTFSNGFLLTMLLVEDNLDAEFVEILRSKVPEEAMFFMYNVDERWIKYFTDFELYIIDHEMRKYIMRERNKPSFLWSTLRLLLNDGHSKKLLSKLRLHQSPSLIRIFFNIIYNMGCTSSAAKIALDDLRPRNDYDYERSFANPPARLNGVDLFTTIASDLLQLILSFCIKNDWLHVIISCSRVCKRFHQFTSVSDIKNLSKMITTSKFAARRLINDANRYKPDSSKYRLGYPWRLSNRVEIFSLFVHAMTTPTEPWTLDELFEDHVKDFPCIDGQSVFITKTYGRYNLLIESILCNHQFTDEQQFKLFAKRAISISPHSVHYKLENCMEGCYAMKCLEDLVADANILCKLTFSYSSVALLLTLPLISNPTLTLERILSRRDSCISEKILFQFIFIKYHFESESKYRNALQMVSERRKRNTDRDLNPDRMVMMKVLEKYATFYRPHPAHNLAKFLLDAVMNGTSKPTEWSPNLLEIIVNYFCSHRLPADQFERFLNCANREAAGLELMYSILTRFALGH